jgi:hypothetical protein
MADIQNPWSDEFWNLTEQGRYITRFGIEVAKTKARQAGTKLGAPRKRNPVPETLRVLVQRREPIIQNITIGSGGGGSSTDGPPS